jgi:hypothetical protein
MVLVSANEIIGEGFEDTNLTETMQEKKMIEEAIAADDREK